MRRPQVKDDVARWHKAMCHTHVSMCEALDSESEVIVQEALDNVLSEQKTTTVVIAHRLSTIRNADKIVVIVDGRVVEQGTHDELMGCSTGHYRTLVDKQEGGGSASASRTSSHVDLIKMDNGVERALTGQEGAVHFAFRDVTFCYPTRPTKKVFDGFNLDVRSGETVALVGPSGGGTESHLHACMLISVLTLCYWLL